jgi:uncharacterized lipoprotein YehR (DUF1307 family)
MKRTNRFVLVGAALVALLGLAGCGEKEQVVVYKQGKYQGKPDSKPWENEPGSSLYTTSKWAKGDKTGWENALKSRNQNQNEYTRVE